MGSLAVYGEEDVTSTDSDSEPEHEPEVSPGTLGLDLDGLADPISLASKDDSIQLYLNPESGKLIVLVDGPRYSIVCLDVTTIRAELTLPEFDLPATVTVSPETLQRGVKAANLVADHIRIRLEDDCEALVVEAEGDTTPVRPPGLAGRVRLGAGCR